jgi:hypothetical protein
LGLDLSGCFWIGEEEANRRGRKEEKRLGTADTRQCTRIKKTKGQVERKYLTTKTPRHQDELIREGARRTKKEKGARRKAKGEFLQTRSRRNKEKIVFMVVMSFSP